MMETGDLPPPKSDAPLLAPSPGNPSFTSPSLEEGELSSGDGEDAELPTSTAALNNKLLFQPILVSTKKLVRNPQTGNNSSMANTMFHTSSKRYYRKSFMTKQVPFKSSNNRTLTWHKKTSNDNLVISFSDDDSETDYGHLKSNATTEKKANEPKPIKCKMPMMTAQGQQGLFQQSKHHGTKLVPKKGVVGHVSLTNEKNGSNFGHFRTYSTEKAAHIQKHGTALNASINQVGGQIRDTGLTDSAVESLRHQIAVRENELKVQMKSISQNQDKVTGSDSHNLERLNQKLVNQITDIHGAAAAAANIRGTALHTRPAKRLKLDETSEFPQGFDEPLEEHSSKRMVEAHVLRKDECSSLVARSALDYDRTLKNVTLSMINKGTDKQHLHTGLKDDDSILHCCTAASASYTVPGTNVKLEAHCYNTVNDKRHDQVNENVPSSSKVLQKGLEDDDTLLASSDTASPYLDSAINYTEEANNNVKESVLLTSALLDQSSNLALFLQNAKSSLAKGSSGADFVSLKCPIEKHSVNALEDKLPDAEIGIPEEVIMNLESLLELEELRDKELDEAQEVRRRCELEERHALKAYRKAQRALVNANERCAILQRNREMVSAKLQTLMLGSSNSMQPSNEPNHGDSLQYTTLSFDMSGKGQTQEHLANKSKSQFLDGTFDGSYIQMNRHASSSNQYSEPDDSASDHRDKNAVNGVSSPTSFPYLTTDEDQDNLPQDNQCDDSNLACPTNVGNHKENNNDTNVNKEQNSQDYDLEASLRSKLVARFGVRASCKNADMNNVECQVDLTASTVDMKSDTLDQQLQVQKNICVSNPKGLAVAGGIIDLASVEQCGQSQKNKFSSKDDVRIRVDPEEKSSFLKESSFSSCPLIFSLPSAVLHNVLPLLKVKVPAYDTGVSYSERKGSRPMDKSHEFAFYMQNFNEYARGSYDNNIITYEMGYSMCDLSIDPFWPFCMFELRGKCNDDECPWQHDNKSINRKITRDGCLISYNSDVNIDALTGKISIADLERTHGLGKPFLPVPAYYIGSSLIKAESHFCHSLLARNIWQYWQRGFSASFPLPFSIQRILPQDAPFLQISDGNVADYDSWSRHSWYLEIQDDKRKKDIQGSLDSEYSLELVLKFFRGNFNKSDKKKALSLLSRSIEVDPTSIVVWIVYLHIFYMKEKGTGKDDMFLLAVQHNRSSYELWLMFINSRVKLNDRLNAYNEALSMLCHGKLTSDKEKKNRSAYVLDIFLQMVDFLCMCGSVEKAVGRIYQLVSTLESEVSGDSLLAEILSILTVPDQCIFWICCMYLVVYKKLPKEIVQDFESQKDLPFSLEWPSVQFTTEESDQIAELMKFFLQKVAIDVGDNHVRGDITALRSMHFIAVSHVRLVTALNGFDRSSELLVKYRKLYPTCIELVLLSVRSQENCSSEEFLRLFGEVRHEWPREVPGIQCIWNQFIEHALVKGADCAEKLIEQWFQQFGELNDSRFRNLDGNDASLCGSSKQSLLVESADIAQTYLDDKTFGLLNLSVHKMLKNDVEGAFNAVDEALKLASPKCYSHVIKEHAAVFRLKRSKSTENTHSQGIFRLLNNYLHDPRFLPRRELLSRQYYQNVKKLRLRKLIDEIIGSVSVDFSRLNSVLDVSFGQTFLPEKVEAKYFVDLVELLMELTPANYQLALSVHKFCARCFGGSVDVSCAGVMLWASSLLVNSIFQAVPVAPESIWLEAADLLGHSIGRVIAERFHQQALSVYPFSLKLWKSYLNLTKMTGNADTVIEAASERGLELTICPD